MEFAGHEDWRLPNIRELLSIVDYGGRLPAVDPALDALPSTYWSSTSDPIEPGGAFFVTFVGSDFRDEGDETPPVLGVNYKGGFGAFYVRAVRNAP